ncbi:response regulator transcription factor [Herbaspirillum rhizosphaerae]|uniref:Response regulator transcription factor n=1 Tax=Herbaspirillum rhizosphaerae TaxID=346179 RepID=A0ABW8ZCN6_9BURK
MHISVFSHSAADIALIARSLPAHDCQGVQQRADLRRAHPQLLIVDIASAGAHLADLLQMAGTPAIPVLLLAADTPSDLAALAALPAEPVGERLIDSEFKPLRRNAVAARVKLLLQRAYPDHDEKQVQQFGDYVFESPAHIVTHASTQTTLTQKEFALAVLLFSNLGRPLSRAYLQESVWGQEDENELPTRTIDTHISRVRNKLELKPEKGFRLTTVYGYGYQLEQLK